MGEVPPSFKKWEEPNTGLIFSCPEDWQVSATDLATLMLDKRLAVPSMVKVFRISGFNRSDDPRLQERIIEYINQLKPSGERLRSTGYAEWAEAFGKRGVQLHCMQGRFKCSIFLVVHDDFLVALWAEWEPNRNHDEEIEGVLGQVFGSFCGKLKQANKLYFLDEPELPPVFARADIDNRLIGNWCNESYTSIPSAGHSNGFSYSSSRWITLLPNGRFEQGSSLSATMHHYGSTGDMTGTTHGLTEGQGERRGSWRVSGQVLRLNFDEGTYADYKYQVWPDSMLLTTANDKESYWKKRF
ncbi:hypothetical protein N9219_03550 [bacterium]|nr:hypothetical protein [bacterium]